VSQTVFGFGSAHGFNLLDGEPGIVFFGYFHDMEPLEIAVRARFLLQNIGLAYERIGRDRSPETVLQRQPILSLLSRISVEVLAPENCDRERLAAKIDEYQPEARKVEVSILTPAEIEQWIKDEYEKMKF
jgi:hypothetical protein